MIQITKIEHEYHKNVWLCYWSNGGLKGRYSITVAAAYSLLQNDHIRERQAGRHIYIFNSKGITNNNLNRDERLYR